MSAVGTIARWSDSPFDWMNYKEVSSGVRKPVPGLRYWLLYKLVGFHYVIEYECVEGYSVGTAHLPHWARGSSAGIVGTWEARRRRLYLRYLPLGRWKKWGKR